MLLVTLVVTKHVDAIKIRFIKPARLVRAALLQYQPAPRLRLLTRILVGYFLGLTIQSLPRNKLTSSAIKNNVTRHCKFYLLAVNPPCRRRRRRGGESHLVPEFVWFFLLRPFFALLSWSRTTLLCTTSFWSNVTLDRFRRLRLGYTLPANNVKARTTVEPHHDVFVVATIRCETKIRTRLQLSSRLSGHVFIFRR